MPVSRLLSEHLSTLYLNKISNVLKGLEDSKVFKAKDITGRRQGLVHVLEAMVTAKAMASSTATLPYTWCRMMQ